MANQIGLVISTNTENLNCMMADACKGIRNPLNIIHNGLA